MLQVGGGDEPRSPPSPAGMRGKGPPGGRLEDESFFIMQGEVHGAVGRDPDQHKALRFPSPSASPTDSGATSPSSMLPTPFSTALQTSPESGEAGVEGAAEEGTPSSSKPASNHPSQSSFHSAHTWDGQVCVA